MKTLKAALVGAGKRGKIYCNYALYTEGKELEIVAVVDPLKFTLDEAAEKYGVKEENRFSSIEEFVAKKIECDFVVNATMDEIHYETAMKLINAGYNLILEKPLTAKKAELLEIERAAKEKGVKILVCHVLRYTPFYRAIKKVINEGKIGKVMSMEMHEHVGKYHFLNSFVRGKWHSEQECGSGLLLAKCCHDTDLMCWLNGETVPEKVSSFGSRSHFIKENAPADATEYCYNCPHVKTCIYSSQKTNLECDWMSYQTWQRIGKPLDSITYEEKVEFLKHDTYGKCAYNSGGDIVDRQNVSVEFANGSIASLTMIGGCSKEDRFIHIVGTEGEIKGFWGENKFEVLRFQWSEGLYEPTKEIIDVSQNIVNKGGHGGGDYALMQDAVRFFAGEGESVSVTKIEDSINGHLIVYAAEESRKTGKIVKIEK
ncbi:MAG: Gfo/Idh/MocA family oxidoreductase [Clostridia bacterium]|nr:Gfo/Idh/MocA family oxidoreductase [Clostridia bacterium]